MQKLVMLKVECIARGYLTGSGWGSYQEFQQVCGIPLPAGLHDGSRLPSPIFTPTTKAEKGHDVHLSTQAVNEQYGESLGNRSLAVYQTAAQVAEDKGLILADTKFEYGEGEILADEVVTPDSSRFWDREEWQQACEQRTSPPPFDKELVRKWGSQFGLKRLSPESPPDLDFVSQLTVPQGVLAETAWRYEEVLQRLTGMSLGVFQQSKLGVA